MIDVSKRLEEIAAAIKGGAPASRYQKEIDRLLGTEMDDRDSLVEAEAQSRWDIGSENE